MHHGAALIAGKFFLFLGSNLAPGGPWLRAWPLEHLEISLLPFSDGFHSVANSMSWVAVFLAW